MRVSIDDLIRRDTITEMILKLSIFRYCKPYALISGGINSRYVCRDFEIPNLYI
jgi:hypothetical protein